MYSVWLIFRTVYWSIFGMADYDAVELGQYGLRITSVVGEILFGIYNWTIIIILINMLIAMMARSYEIIAVSKLSSPIDSYTTSLLDQLFEYYVHALIEVSCEGFYYDVML